jgi:iron(II)-dependent oxidoreductase
VIAADASAFARATVAFASLDSETTQPAEWTQAAELPVRGAWVAPGCTRIRVESSQGQVREYTRMATAGQETTIDVSADIGAIADDMVLVRGGVLELPPDTSKMLPLADQKVPLDDFLLDRTEVTNRDYRAFLDASRREPPSHWARVLASHDRLPVVNVSWEDALAFAEWAGKRLPTFAEWTWAARGAENRIYPWAGAVKGQLRGNVQHDVVATWTNEQVLDQYFERASPVGTHPDASTPEGMQDMFGNVNEWTESVFAERTPAGLKVHVLLRFVAGHAWSDGTKGHTLATFGSRGVGRPYASGSLGFRCARSVGNRR